MMERLVMLAAGHANWGDDLITIEKARSIR
jgi:hypothetical protein